MMDFEFLRSYEKHLVGLDRQLQHLIVAMESELDKEFPDRHLFKELSYHVKLVVIAMNDAHRNFQAEKKSANLSLSSTF